MDERKQKVKIMLGLLVAGVIVGSVLAVQYIGYRCNYDSLLGNGLYYSGIKIYSPLNFWQWQEVFSFVIPEIILMANRIFYGSIFIFFIFALLIIKKSNKATSHGSAEWANLNDIIKSKVADTEGVVLGINPFTNKLLRHDGPEHISLMAPTRSGKGVGSIIPTLLTWKHSVFVTDVKGENWHFTAAYRRDVIKQRVIKFDPMCSDGSSARWNPLAEIHFRAEEEFSDIQNIVTMIVDPEGKGQLDYWANTGSALLIGTILHLLYANYRKGKRLPTLTDIASFLSSPERSLEEQLQMMKTYDHISPEEFMSDKNILEDIYGEYISNFEPYMDYLGVEINSMAELKAAIQKSSEEINFEDEPFNLLLTHPRVASAAAEMLNKAPNEQSGVLSTAKTFLNLYQNPVIEKNISVSDFCISDLLNPDKEISFYLIIPPRDLGTLKPLCRLLINTILRSLIKQMEFSKKNKVTKEKLSYWLQFMDYLNDKFDLDKVKEKQRLLLLLDEFPQFGRLDTMETALAVCAGYGIKVCIISQDINQLNKAYTKDNSILSNCHVHIYFTPNIDGNTAPLISKMLGKKTITVQSSSAQNGVLFKGSTSTSSTGRELMTPDEINTMSAEREIVFVAGNKPIFAKKLRYYKEKFFTSKSGYAEANEPLKSDTCTVISDYDSLLEMHRPELENKLRRKISISKLTMADKMKE